MTARVTAWSVGTCPNCGKTDWCQQSDTGAYMCRRGPGKGLVERRDRSRVPYWLYLPAGAERVNLTPTCTGVERAPAKDLHLVYGTLLGWLDLSDVHLADWQRRGVHPDAIARHGVRTWPPTRKEKRLLAVELYRAFGDLCRRVPGWYVRDTKPMLSGGTGWVVPMWDIETGGVCALRLRSDSSTGPKYYWISSGGAKGGASSGSHARLAWPGRHPERQDRADVVRITEGEAKSIVLAECTGIPTVSVPGVSSWSLAIPWLRWLKASKVLLCYDADVTTNKDVARAFLAARTGLHREGYRVAVETWRERIAG